MCRSVHHLRFASALPDFTIKLFDFATQKASDAAHKTTSCGTDPENSSLTVCERTGIILLRGLGVFNDAFRYVRQSCRFLISTSGNGEQNMPACTKKPP